MQKILNSPECSLQFFNNHMGASDDESQPVRIGLPNEPKKSLLFNIWVRHHLLNVDLGTGWKKCPAFRVTGIVAHMQSAVAAALQGHQRFIVPAVDRLLRTCDRFTASVSRL
jgi:hypothetical protein